VHGLNGGLACNFLVQEVVREFHYESEIKAAFVRGE